MEVVLTIRSHLFRICILLPFALLFFGTVPVEAQENFSLRILDIGSNARGTVRLIVSATDAHGAPIRELHRSDFRLDVEQLPIRDFTVEPVSSAKNPLSVFLAFDVSGSMNGTPMDAAKAAAIEFLDRLGTDDYAAVLSFGSGVRLLCDFTSNKESVKQSLETVAAGDRNTWLYEATFESLQQAANAPTARAAIVLLTDGKDEGSPRTKKSVLDRIRGVRIPVFALGFGTNLQKAYLEEIAAASGGSFLFAPTAEDLGQLYAQVYEQLRNQYQIEFRFAKPAGEYIATLELNHEGIRKSARASFLHALTGEPARPVQQSQSFDNWFVYLVLIVLAVLVALSLVTFILHLRARKARRSPSGIRVELMIEGKRSLLSTPASGVDSKMTVLSQAPSGEAGIVVELPNAPAYLPLVDEAIGRKYDEVVITRFDKAGKFQKEKTYLLISDRSVSRPDGKRIGHAVIFLNQKSGRHQIRDLGSIGGTRLHGVRLKGSAYLENGDRIIIGTVSMKYYDMRSGGEADV